MFKRNRDNELSPSPRLHTDRTQHKQPVLVCANCSQFITMPSESVEISGSHTHVFTNPHGMTFRIGCFANADGCRLEGHATYEHTWFIGHQWRYALCAGCRTHLGWQFLHPNNRFFGLILIKLMSQETR